MKRIKKQKRFEYLCKVFEVAYEECDLDQPNFNISNLVLSGVPCTMLTASSTDKVTIQAVIPDKGKWDGLVAIGIGKTILSAPLTKLIDTLQSLKDKVRGKNEFDS